MADKLNLDHQIGEVIGELGKGDKIAISEVGMNELDDDDVGRDMLWGFRSLAMDAFRKFGADLSQFKLLVYERKAKKYLNKLEIVITDGKPKFRKTVLIGKKRKADAERGVKP